MGIAGEHGQLPRRVIEVDAQNGESAGRDHTLAESNAKMAGPAFSLHLEVTQAALQQHLRIATPALTAQDRQRQRAVGRKAGHASVFKLDLRTAVFRGRHLGSLKQWRIRQGWVRQHLAALGNPHLPLHAAQPRRPCRRRRIFRSQSLRQQDRSHGKSSQPQHSGPRPPRFRPSTIPGAIHKTLPSQRPVLPCQQPI